MAAHTPYGYVIKDGRAEIDEIAAGQVRAMYENYLSGDSLMTAAEKAGINKWHGSVSRLLGNKKYLGTKYYPAFIEQKLFDATQKERHKRAVALGRIYDEKKEAGLSEAFPFNTRFWMRSLVIKFQDPYRQAEFAYSLIESEVGLDGTE